MRPIILSGLSKITIFQKSLTSIPLNFFTTTSISSCISSRTQMCQLHDAALAAVNAGNSADLTGAHSRDQQYTSTLIRPDPSSWSNHGAVKVVSYDVDFNVNFESSQLEGSVVYEVEAVCNDPKVISLDFKGQTISNIKVNDTEADSWVSHYDGVLGQSLVIVLPTLAKGEKAKISLDLKTSPDASALQWLPREQTATKLYPYLFTQCQAIHCRTVFPCQDTPGVKSSYTATITVPASLTALMSAVIEDPNGTVQDSKRVFKFTQKVPIPAYLFALAVGEVEKRDISPRCAVWADPVSIEKCATEFSDLDKMISIAEDLNGPYVWGRYDVLVLPPSFPYGGMENPCLTFATPSIVAGDKSLVNVILHEAQHSWSGNLVTNDTWESFFLNEGFTVFGERKLVEKFYGKEQKGLHTAIGWQDLKESVQLLGPEHPFTCLQTDLSNEKDPDDAFCSVPYEKGFTLLAYLESIVGKEVMESFLKAYFSHFSYQSLNTQQFKEFFLEYVKKHGVTESQLSTIQWDTWFYKPGMPEKVPFDDSLAVKSVALAHDLLDVTKDDVDVSCLSSWSTSQKIVMLDTLVDAVDTSAFKVDPEGLKKQSEMMRTKVVPKIASYFESSGNAELKFRYLSLLVRISYPGQETQLKNFLSSIGRMKFVRPLYRDIFASALYREFGINLFNELKGTYHNICSKMTSRDLTSITAGETIY